MPSDNKSITGAGSSDRLTLNRRQLLGSAATGAAAFTLPTMPAWAQAPEKTVDVLVVGGGIMSSTLAVFLSELEPTWTIQMLERLDDVAMESSNGWNNAGTGHSALAELNYTPQDSKGNVHIEKAVEINEGFQITRQFFSHQIDMGVLKNPRSFINSTPHMSFVWGDENTEFLRKRHEALKASPLFSGMQFSTDHDEIAKWVPLMMEGRDPSQKIAATWCPLGTDVNFGEIVHQYVAHLKSLPTFNLRTNSEVREIERNADGTWSVATRIARPASVVPSRRNSSSSAPAAGHCRSCRCRAFRKARTMPASRSVDPSSSATTRKSSTSISPRPMARLDRRTADVGSASGYPRL